MAETTAYVCPQCGAALALDPESGKMTCEFCEGSFTVEEIEAKADESTTRKKAEERVEAAEKEKPKAKRSSKKKGSASIPSGLAAYSIDEWEERLASGAQEHLQDVVCYTCRNCGAEVVTDKLTVATSCQYCGSNVVVDDRVLGSLKPDYVIPFKVKADDLPQKLTKFYEKRPLLPKNFFYDNQVGEVQGIYVPFWLYNGIVEGQGTYDSHNSKFYTQGDYDVTETTRYRSEREGTVEFRAVPVDASVRIDDDLMDSIEPFDYGDMKPFSPAYLTGFVAERFDQSPREVFSRAGTRMENSARGLFSSDLPGSSVDGSNASFQFSSATASYVMLPVYLFNCKYEGKIHRYAVNGQTGKIVGEVPVGKRASLMEWLKGFAIGAVGGIAVVALFAFAAAVS